MGIIKKLWSLLDRQERRAAIILLVLMIVGMALEAIGVAMILPVLSVMTDPTIFEAHPLLLQVWEYYGRPTQSQLVVGVLVMLLIVSLIKASFLAFLTWRQAEFVARLQSSVAQSLFEGYLRLPWTFHLQRNSAELIRNVTTEIHGFSNGLVIPSLTLFTELTVLLGIAVLLLAIEPQGTLLAAIFLGASILIYYQMARVPLMQWGVNRQFHEGQRIKHLQQALGSVKDVMLLGREDEFISQYRVHNEAGARILKLQTTLAQLPRIWLELLSVLALTVLGLSMLAQGKDAGEIIPVFGMFAAAAFRLLPSTSRMLWAMQSIRFASPIVDTLLHEMQLIGLGRTREEVKKILPSLDRIELDRVSYVYPDTRNKVLDEISLTIPKGMAIGIIGESGAGKSTLVDIILGLVQPVSGRLSVGGMDIQLSLREWQDRIGYVPQAIYLTDDSIRRNVALGLDEKHIDAAALDRAIKAARLEDFVASLPEGLETLVGERGVRLSGGQRQRIGIARALYHDPEVLVFDEATSALDNQTEREVVDAMRLLKKGKTIIMVAHRLSTLEDCDVIYQIHQGAIVRKEPPFSERSVDHRV